MITLSRLLISIAVFVTFSPFTTLGSRPARADETALPMLPGLEQAVEFWKIVFTRHGGTELIFHDSLEPMRIYKVVELGDSNPTRRQIEEEKSKIVREYGLARDDGRIRAQRGVRERFASGLSRSRKYLDQMRRIFQEQGLPLELAYLPLVESSFDIHARSRAGALGMWQFMAATGRRFLRVGPTVDERRDPMESTRAAALFLKENYLALGNWPLAITAYNHGREGILRAIAEVGSRDLMEIIQRYQSPSFGFASKSFYAEFLAALEVAKKSEEFFPDLGYYPPFPVAELETRRPISVAALLKPTDVERSEFLEWNPALNSKIRDIPTGYRIKVPQEKLELFLVAYQRVVEPATASPKAAAVRQDSVAWTHHRVAPGETLSQIAKNYRTSAHEIQQLNRLTNSHLIAVGQSLKIPKR